MGLSRQLVIFGILIGGYQLIQSRSRGKDLEEYYNLKYGAESEGEKVRNRLQGSDVGPQDDMLDNPSIYRDWARVQKGYQSLRMMNDNDNFNSEEAHYNIYEDSFSSEWHYFSECETKGCDGSIEYRDVYACPSCGQDDVEILMGDTCPDCGDIADDVSKYAIFYCSDCGEDYTDEYNSEVQTTSNKVRTISGKPLQLRKLTHDKNLKPEDAKHRLDISAEGMRTCSQCETPKHPLYRGRGSLMGARQICRECNMKAMEGSSSPLFLGNRMMFDAENHAETYRNKKLDDKITAGELTHIYPGDFNNPKLTYFLRLTDAEVKANYPVLACQYCGRDTKMVGVEDGGRSLIYKCDPMCLPSYNPGWFDAEMDIDDYTDEQLLKVARWDIENQIDNGTMYAIGEEPEPFDDGENFYTIVSLYAQYHKDEDKAEKILWEMFREEYPQYLGTEQGKLNADPMTGRLDEMIDSMQEFAEEYLTHHPVDGYSTRYPAMKVVLPSDEHEDYMEVDNGMVKDTTDAQELAANMVLRAMDMRSILEDLGSIEYDAESFGATVYRGKPMSELGYVDRAMATKRMIESADIEQSILQLEAAIRMGLISEEDIMDQLRDKFGSE